MTAAETRAAVTSDRIDLVDEYDRCGMLFGICEQVTDTGRADTDVHLNEVRAGDGEEGNARLSRYRLCEQGLTCAGRADEQYTVRYLCAEAAEMSGILEELNYLDQLLLFLVCARNVGEGDALFIRVVGLGVRLAEGAYLSAPAVRLIHHKYPQRYEQTYHYQIGQQADPPRYINGGGHIVVCDNAALLLLIDRIAQVKVELLEGAELVADGAPVLKLHLELIALVENEALDLLALEEVDDLTVLEPFGARVAEHERGGDYDNSHKKYPKQE